MKQYTSQEYYVKAYDGYEEFLEGKTCSRLRKALNYLNPQPGQVILDIGCGRGEILRECSVKSEVIGIDFSDASMDFARRQGQPLVKATATHLPFGDEAFNSVLLLEVVEHLSMDDVEKCSNEIRRVLKVGGTVVVETPLVDFPLDKILKAYLKRHKTLGSFYTDWKKPKPVIDLIKRVFKILKVEEELESDIKDSIKQLSERGVAPHRKLWVIASKDDEIEGSKVLKQAK